MTLDQITAFFAWMTLLNLVFYSVTALIVVSCKGWLMRTHARMLRIAPETLPALYMGYLARWKLLFIVFALIPYLALRFGVA